jgi:hypothetical protein
MLYDVSEHPLLSGKAKAMVRSDEDKFTEWGNLAESILGFDVITPVMTGAKAKEAKRYIALQVNWMIDATPDALMLKSISSGHSGQSKVFRDNILINPMILTSWKKFVQGMAFTRGIRSLRG